MRTKYQAIPSPLLERKGVNTLPVQIQQNIKTAIAQGTLKQGDRLPSTRSLASQLNVSRNSVEIAFEMLQGEGLIVSKGAAGSFVSSGIAMHQLNQVDSQKNRPTLPPQIDQFTPSSRMYLHPCVPSFDLFPLAVWKRLVQRRLRNLNPHDLAMGDPSGYWDLKVTIASYLQLARGITCEPSRIVITRGFQGGLELISRALLKTGDEVVLEDPGYRYARALFEQAGMSIKSAPLDADGLCIEWISNHTQNPKLISVTPSHQSPTGVMLSHQRRLDLLEMASYKNCWILEDDYDSEYRYAGPPLPSLKSLDLNDRVIYAGTFSKVLFPGIKVAYLLLPESLVAACQLTMRTFQSGCSTLEQMVINDFIQQGHFSRHIRKMRNHYKSRRKWLCDALKAAFDQKIQIDLHKNGMHLIAMPSTNLADQEMAGIARTAGFGLQALSEWSVNSTRQGLLLGFTNIHSQAEAIRLAFLLRNLFRENQFDAD